MFIDSAGREPSTEDTVLGLVAGPSTMGRTSGVALPLKNRGPRFQQFTFNRTHRCYQQGSSSRAPVHEPELRTRTQLARGIHWIVGSSSVRMSTPESYAFRNVDFLPCVLPGGKRHVEPGSGLGTFLDVGHIVDSKKKFMKYAVNNAK